jgi:hypothetical protein
MRLTIQSDWVGWYVIEWAPINDTQQSRACSDSPGFSDAAVEGSDVEMLHIARAIEARGFAHYRRCAVQVVGERVSFWSPRNSRGGHGVVTLAEADELASEIQRVLEPDLQRVLEELVMKMEVEKIRMSKIKFKTDEKGNKRCKNSEGQLHREDGPAVEYADGTRHWYLNGKLHREDGPAVEWADGRRQWYLNGKELTEDQWREKISNEQN